MDYTVIKWIVFVTLLLTVPAVLFLIQVVFFVPAIFFLAGMIGMVAKFSSGSLGELGISIAFFGVHLLVFGSLYYGLSALLAKLISAVSSPAVRAAIVVTLVLGLGALILMPVYGGGGHQPVKWVLLFSLLEPSYGPAAIPLVYVPTIAVVAVLLARRHWNIHRRA